jgi:hypothetical protein
LEHAGGLESVDNEVIKSFKDCNLFCVVLLFCHPEDIASVSMMTGNAAQRKNMRHWCLSPHEMRM